MSRSRRLAAPLLAALVAVLGLRAAPAMAQAAPLLTSPAPAAGALVTAGTVEVGIRAEAGAGEVRLRVDGVERPVEGDRPGRLRAEVALSAGTHVAEAVLADAGGVLTQRSWRFEVSDVTVRRVAGADRLATAIALSTEQFPTAGSASQVVLARADDFADALGGAPLALRLDGPLLLTASDHLPPAVADELRRLLGPGGSVVVLGGTAAVGPQVEAQVAELGLRVRRLSGADRYATAAQVAGALWAESATSRTAVLVSGEAFPDALSASVPAAIGGWPILLTRAGELPPDSAAALAGVERLVVVGGEAAVSAAALDQARAATPELGAPGAVERLAGPTRFATAAEVAATLPASPAAALVSGTAFPDALAGAPFAARLGSPLLLVDTTLPAASAAVLAPTREVLVLGGAGSVGDEVVAAARRVVDDGGPPPALDPAPGSALGAIEAGTTFRIASDLTVDAAGSQAQLEVDGAEVPLTLRAEGTVLVAEVTAAPAPGAADLGRPHDVRLVAAVRGAGIEPVRHVEGAYTAPAAAPAVPTPEGFVRVGGDGEVAGMAGPLVTYSLEVEPATGVDPGAFAREAEAVLSDARGWSGRGERRLQRVGGGTPAIRVVLATPATVDRFCARAGLDTAGRYSCWNGTFAMINLERWTGGSPAFAAPLADYRGYVLNHETGHGLGRSHVGCPAAGALAPVMVQQTISTGGCLPNAWPYP